MRNWKPLLILALIAGAIYYVLPSVQFYQLAADEKVAMEESDPAAFRTLKQSALNLGLDLQGGIHLVLEVELEKLPAEEATDAVERTLEVLRNRIDQFGVAEPTIQKQGQNRIIIELPGVQDVQRAKSLIGQTALLEFQLLETNEERDRLLNQINTLTAPQSQSQEGTDDSTTVQGLFDQETGAADDGELALYSMISPLGGDIAVPSRYLARVKNLLQSPRALAQVPDDMEFLFSSKAEGQSGSQYYMLYLARVKPEMTGNLIQDAQVTVGQSIEYLGQHIVNLTTTDDGVRRFREITGRHVGERLAIVLDQGVYSAPVIQGRIPNGRSVITGNRTPEEAKDLAIILRAGALPADVEIIEDRTVGPSLGRDSIEQGRQAALISMVVVALFMVLYYRVAGIVAVIALGLNVLFVFSVLSGFHATLTLPGIAGIILTIGMAVDANVLIFERIREEIRRGKTTRAAIDSGYGNALSAIMDANITTLFVGIVLYEFGTGPIRGFALTLCIGILSSLLTALLVTRSLLDLVTRGEQTRSLSIGPVGFLSNPGLQFLVRRKFAFTCSLAVIALGLISVAAINHLRPGIDFAGGTLIEVHLEPAPQIESIRDALKQVPVGDRTLDLSSGEIKEFGSSEDILIRVVESTSGTAVADGIKEVLKTNFGSSITDELEWIRRQELVGPKIGHELTQDALQAILVSLGLILLYMAWRFHRFLFGIAAVVALFHDVLITLGLLSLLDVEITLAVVAALLAIVGYSLNDTIVVFDRIRENLSSTRQLNFMGILDLSINECLSRTLITSVTTLAAVLILMIWGGPVNRDFTITLLIGILVGTYSSVFIASPVVLYGQERVERKERQANK
ncbi:MAG: protein translocase subunit SecD [Candidatus Latescibacteria bacterium]|nr:protein translocase subunit SecD [Candidatus Latescibacterota bacterium]